MTQSEEARLAVLESRMDDVCSAVSRVETKLDAALERKADAAYVAAVDGRVTEVRGWLWGLAGAVLVSLLGAVVSIGLALVR